MPTEYTTVSIPRKLHEQLKRIIAKDKGFKSVSDYATFVLREVVILDKSKPVPEALDSEDFEGIRRRLQTLGRGDAEPNIREV